MNVLVATGLSAPDIGGPATYTAMLEAELPDRGFVVTVVSFRSVRRYPKVLRHALYAWRVWRASRTADVVYALDPISVGLPALLVANLGGDYAWEQGRVRFGVTQTLDEYTASRAAQPWAVRAVAYIQAVVARRAAQVIVPSQYLQSIVETWGVSAEKITVIYSALHPTETDQAPPSILNKVHPDWPLLLSAGRLVPWKGFAMLITLIAQYKQAGRDVSLVIAGDGPDQALLESLIAEHGVSDRVQLAGRLRRPALATLIATADVFVLNTAYEGLAHQLVEVMDIGTPIVTTTAGGNTELVTDGVDGLLVSFNDMSALQQAISKLLDTPLLGQQFVVAAKRQVARFAPGPAIAQLDKTLRASGPK